MKNDEFAELIDLCAAQNQQIVDLKALLESSHELVTTNCRSVVDRKEAENVVLRDAIKDRDCRVAELSAELFILRIGNAARDTVAAFAKLGEVVSAAFLPIAEMWAVLDTAGEEE